jgi:hypothetical protein
MLRRSCVQKLSSGIRYPEFLNGFSYSFKENAEIVIKKRS